MEIPLLGILFSSADRPNEKIMNDKIFLKQTFCFERFVWRQSLNSFVNSFETIFKISK